MKEIKLIHVATALILVLSAIAILQWATLPKGVRPPAAESSSEPDQLTKLPVLPQNELSKPIAVPFAEGEPSFFEKSSLANNDEPKDSSSNSGKPLL